MAGVGPGGRTVVGSVSLSLDGRVAGPGGGQDADWVVRHARSDDVRDHLARLHGPATAALVGGEDAEALRAQWSPVADDPAADDRDRAFARWFDEVEKLIVSATVDERGWRNAWVLDVTPLQVAKQLRRQGGGDVLVLGGSAVRDLLTDDALDRLAVVWCPEVLGGGERLLDDGLPRSSWELARSSTSDTGAVSAVYDRVR